MEIMYGNNLLEKCKNTKIIFLAHCLVVFIIICSQGNFLFLIKKKLYNIASQDYLDFLRENFAKSENCIPAKMFL